MKNSTDSSRVNRRVALRWISAAAASVPILEAESFGAEQSITGGAGYGPDPDMLKVYQPGDLWPLTFSDAQRKQVITLCDIIIPADASSPSASSVGVHDFIDEWISSPYPGQKSDRNAILKGLQWLDEEASRRGGSNFNSLPANAQLAICQELAIAAKRDRKTFPGSFFLRLRDLAAGGYYTTPEGMKDIGYRGNLAMPEWNGPPAKCWKNWDFPLKIDFMKMKNTILSLLFLAGALMPLHAEGESDFVSIFNGKDLSDWDGQPGSWEVRDGEIWCTGTAKERNWLIWRKEQPADFILKLEFRWDKGNSGVQVRSDDLGDWQVFGYQVEVAQRDVMGLWHHSLLDKEHPKKKARHLMTTAGEDAVIGEDGSRINTKFEEAAKVQAQYKEHDWNTMEIIAKGDTLTQKINGVVFATVTDRDSEMRRKSGFIALQDHGKGCIVAFRNIRLKTLP